MKIDNNQLLSKEDIEMAVLKKQQKELSLVGMSRYNRSHQIFCYNKTQKELSIAKERETDTFIIGKSGIDIDVEENCIYFQKMNFANAKKYLEKNGYKVLTIVK